MLRLVLFRGLIFAVPFAAWLIWREVSRRTGRPMGSTPWASLVAAGAALAALSLVATALLPHGRDTGQYVPAQTRPDGTITKGHFAPKAQAQP